MFDFSHVHEDCRETRFENLLVAVYRVRRARIGENPERIAREMWKKRGEEARVKSEGKSFLSSTHESRGSCHFRGSAALNLFHRFFERKNRPSRTLTDEIPRLHPTQHTLPIQPRLTIDYRVCIVAVHVACEEERYRASIVARSFRSGYDRTDDRTRYLFSVPGNQRP